MVKPAASRACCSDDFSAIELTCPARGGLRVEPKEVFMQ